MSNYMTGKPMVPPSERKNIYVHDILNEVDHFDTSMFNIRG